MPGNDAVFEAQSSDVRLLSSALRPISHVSHVTVMVSATGLEFLTTSERTFQAHAYVKEKLFVKWKCEQERAADSPMNTASDDQADSPRHAFDISLKRFIDCLDIFGSAGTKGAADSDRLNERPDAQRGPTADVSLDKGKRSRTSMKLAYDGKGSPLVLELVDNEVVTRCDISTMEPDEAPILGMDHTDSRAQMILEAEWITAALQNFHQSCTRVTFCFTPASRADRRGSLCIFGDTDWGSVEATLPADGKAVAKFDCVKKTQFTYSFSRVSLALKGLQAANKASIRVDGSGLLSIQCLIPISASLMEDATKGGRIKIEAGHLPIVDYLCCPFDD